MLSDLQIALLLQSQYDGEVIFDYQDTIEDVTFAVKSFEDCTALLFEGSHNAPDWCHDFEAFMLYPMELNGAGVHAGFYSGLTAAIEKILPYLPKNKKAYVAGHSLGAGRVDIASAILAAKGYTDLTLIKFGSPRSGNRELVYAISAFPCRSYWNYQDDLRHDLVGDVPFDVPVALPYVVTPMRIRICVPPGEHDPWGEIMGWHHMQNYLKGLKNG